MLEYIDLALKVVITVNLSYFTYEYMHLYSKFKSLYNKMTDQLKTILNNDPSPATRLKKSKPFHPQIEKNCFSDTKLNLAEK